ncbi:MAG: hypothetical protein JSS50_01980 [Proteobacteria bacterium]|nr:hypothetical protein [Pseudomonadota bacterium]
MNSLWKKVITVAKRCFGAISRSIGRCCERTIVTMREAIVADNAPRLRPTVMWGRAVRSVFYSPKTRIIAMLQDGYNSAFINRLPQTLQQRRILRPQRRAASTRLQQSSWLSVLGMPAISYILEYEKHGLLRFSAPLFVLIIRSYLL